MEFPCYIEHCPKLKLKNGMMLQGHSKGGERTSFKIMPLNVVVDGGLASRQPSNAVFVTHSHSDHTHNLPWLTNRAKPKMPIICHPKNAVKIERLIHCSHALGKDNDDNILIFDEYCKVQDRYRMVTCNAGDNLLIPEIPNTMIEVLQAHHACMKCFGYGFNSIRQKIKPEYKGLSRNEIVELRKQKIEITEEVHVPQLIFFCDSSIENLTEHDEWKKYPVVVCECTGMCETLSYDYDHTSITELLPVLLANKDHQYIIIHTSMSLKPDFLKTKELELRAMNLDVTIWHS